MNSKIRRVVTSNDASGKAVVLLDGPSPNVKFRETTGIVSTLLWVTDSTPPDISGDADTAEREMGVAPPTGGSIFRIVELPPAGESEGEVNSEEVLKEMGLTSQGGTGEKMRHPHMHRTESIDYGVIISGEIHLLLDDSDVNLKAGDVVVQRGTNHAWVNRGDKPCRIAFVLIDAKGNADEPMARKSH
jgi:quercetin dioxygenase-like cupin family protein